MPVSPRALDASSQKLSPERGPFSKWPLDCVGRGPRGFPSHEGIAFAESAAGTPSRIGWSHGVKSSVGWQGSDVGCANSK